MNKLTIDNCHLVNALIIRDNNNFTISIIQDRDTNKVMVVVQEKPDWYGKGERIQRFILGRKTIERLRTMDKVLAKKFKMPRESQGE